MKRELFALFAVLIALVFLAAPALAAGIVNGNMESVSQYSTTFCGKFLVTGCQQSSANVWKADTWNTFFHSNDFGQAWNDARSGGYSTWLWYEPPAECGWNFSTGACGPTSYGAEGSLVQHDIVFSNSSFTISFWSKLGGRPVQCNYWNCDGAQYYGGNETNTGRFMFILRDTNSSVNYTSPVYTAGSDWGQTVLSVSGVNTSNRFDLVLQTYAGDLRQTAPNSVLFDDFAVNYTSSNLSPALAYIDDMTTFMSFPFTSISSSTSGQVTASVNNLTTSRGYSTVSLARADILLTAGTNCLYQNINSTVGYIDGTSVVTSQFDTLKYYYGGISSNSCHIGVEFPIVSPDLVRNLTVGGNYNGNASRSFIVKFNVTGLSVRQKYGTSLSGTETIDGISRLYPVIIYDNAVASGVHSFDAYDFGPANSMTDNLLFNLYDAAGTVLQTTTGTYAFTPAKTSWTLNWVTDMTPTDRVIVNFTSNTSWPFMSNTGSVFTLSSATGGCSDGCEGTRYRTATSSGSFCSYSYSADNDTRCYTAPSSAPTSGTSFDFSTPLFGDSGAYTPLTLPWVWFVIGTVVVSGMVFHYTKSEQLSLATLMILMVVWTGTGVLPSWIGIAMIVVILALLAYLMRKLLPFGGGSGGG